MIALCIAAAIRLVLFATAMILFGSSLFALYAPAEARDRTMSHWESRLARALAVGAGILLVLSLMGWLLVTAMGLNDPDDPLPLAEVVRTMLLDTGFGRVRVAQLAVSMVLLGGLLARAPAHIILPLATAVLASEAWIGHAAMGSGLEGILRIVAMTIHVLAAGAWLGGLVPLGLLLRAAGRTDDDEVLAAAGLGLRRFSRMGYIAVTFVLLSGVANTWLIARAPGGLPLPYALVLTAKLLLAAGLIGVALSNRFFLLPSLMGQKHAEAGAALCRLRRNVLFEQILGLFVLGAVSYLGILSPSAG